MYKIKGIDEREYGPVSAEQVRQWIAERRANAATLVQAEGSSEWKPVAAFPEFADALAQANPPLPSSPVGGEPPWPPARRTNPLAVTGLVLGIISIVGGWACCCGSPVAIAGIVFSAIALYQIKSNPLQGGRNQALVGLGLSIIGLLVGVILPFLGYASRNFGSGFRW